MNPAIDSLVSLPERNSKMRVQVVDALRGFALFGILLVHCSQWFSAGTLPNSVYQAHTDGLANGLTQAVVNVLFTDKFYTFFSFLFGLSFALMLTRSTDPSPLFYRRFAWRLIILGIIGFLHHLMWQGDILSIYAIVGFGLLIVSRASYKVILLVAFLLTANLPTRLITFYHTFINPPAKVEAQSQSTNVENDTYYRITKEKKYLILLIYNFYSFDDKLKFQVESGRIYIIPGFFLLGLYAGRKQLFQHLSANRTFFRKLTKYSGFMILGLTAVGMVIVFIFFADSTQPPPKEIEFLFETLSSVHSALLTLFYISGLALFFQKRAWQWAVVPLAIIGKMALTNYILQTVIGTWVFFGFGLNLLGEVDIWVATLLTFPIFLLQILLSKLWLSTFKYGPLEWFWRSLTYLKPQPIRLP